MSIPIKPVGNRILVKLDEVVTEKGGIHLADQAQDKPREAYVVALGTGVFDQAGGLVPFEIQIGDKVLLPRDGAIDVTLDGVEYQTWDAGEVLAILERTDAES